MEENIVQNMETDNSSALMQEILKKMDKQLFFTRLLAIASCLIVILLVGIACVMVPPTVKTLSSADEVMNSANQTMQQAAEAIAVAEEALNNVAAMSDNITETSQNLNQFVLENAETMTSAMKDIDSIDFQGLNAAISDLQAAVGPFANLMRKFN